MKGFGYLVKEGFKNVYANRIMSIASICVLVSCLVLTGAAALFTVNVEKIVDQVQKNNEIIVYISDERTELEAIQIGKKMEQLENVHSTIFVSKEEALEQYKEMLGDQLFARVDEDFNHMPNSFRVSFEDISKYDDTVAQIKQIDGVESMLDRREFAEKLATISKYINIISICVVAALVVISLFIIANTIRATMYSRRFEISIMKSVGATNMFVRMPFLIEGMVIGFISAAISTGALALLYRTLVEVIERTILQFGFIPFTDVVLPLALAFAAVGVLVGFFGGFISIRKYLKKEGNEILGW